MKVSTLQNYYKRKDITPIPRKAQLIKIAEREAVSMEWLLTGSGEEPIGKKQKSEKSDLKTSGHPTRNKGKGGRENLGAFIVPI